MITLTTLGAIRAEGYRLTGCCEVCLHRADLNLDALIDKLGADFNFIDRRDEFLRSLRCGKCGQKRVSSILSADTTGYGIGSTGHN